MAALIFGVRAPAGAPEFMRGRSALALRDDDGNLVSRFSAGPSNARG